MIGRLLSLASVLTIAGLTASASAYQGPAVAVATGCGTPDTPCLLKGDLPAYTDRAKRERFEGDVGLEATVRDDGQLTDIRVVKSLDVGLDRQALDAVKRWRFAPALKDGKPVWSRILFDLRFSLAGPATSSVVRRLESAAETFGAGVYRPPDGSKPDNLVWPKIKRSPPVEYTPAAMDRKTSGAVLRT